MIKRLSLDDMNENVIEFFKGIQLNEDQYLLELKGEPIVGIVPPSKMAREELFQIIDEIHKRNEHIPLEEIERDIEEAVQAVREEERKKHEMKNA